MYEIVWCLHFFYSIPEVRESAGLAFSTLYKVLFLVFLWSFGFMFCIVHWSLKWITNCHGIERWNASNWRDNPNPSACFGGWSNIWYCPWWPQTNLKVWYSMPWIMCLTFYSCFVALKVVYAWISVSGQQLFCLISYPSWSIFLFRTYMDRLFLWTDTVF